MVTLLVVGTIIGVIWADTSVARALPGQKPGTVHYSWLLRWPEKGKEHLFVKRFRAPPGLIRHVKVFIAKKSVASPPNISEVGCGGTGQASATAQKAWLWNGRSVFVALLLSPGQCRVAGTPVRVRIVLTSVGT